MQQVPEWVAAQHTVYLYQRRVPTARCYCPNRGYEAGVYLQFIAEHYDRLPAYTVFVQADWFDSTKGDGLRAPPFVAWTLRCPQTAELELSQVEHELLQVAEVSISYRRRSIS